MWDIIGHDWAVSYLQQAIDARRVAHSYLFVGPAGIGKTHLSLQLASALNCMDPHAPCGRCSVCNRIQRGAYPDVSVIEPDGGRIKIDQIRGLQYELSLSPHAGQWRVCVLTGFETATVEAANALLKTLEEPPSRAILIVCAVDASQLLPTIVSRCQTVSLRAIPSQQIAEGLVDRYGADHDQADLLARLSGGRVGWAVRALGDERLLATREEDLNQLIEILSSGPAERLQVAEKVSKRNDLPSLLHLWQAWWRDVALIVGGCDHLVVNSDYSTMLHHLAQQLSLSQARSAIRGAETAIKQLEQNVNRRLALEVLLLDWTRCDIASPAHS